MFYYVKNSKSKVIHMGGCHYIKDTDEAELGTYKSFSAAYRDGYNPCHHCSEIYKLYRKEKKKISKYKKEDGISIKLYKRYIELKTEGGEWRILPSPVEENTLLFHKNYETHYSDFGSEVPGFHRQKTSYQSLNDYVNYIVPHDIKHLNEKENQNNVRIKPPKLKRNKSHRKHCNQIRAYKNRLRKQRIHNLILTLDCLAVS